VSPADATAADGTAADVTVLVVDDQPTFRQAARAVVDRLAGFTVLAEVDSGEAAVVAAGELHPALVLMDINMGGIDGIEAARAITREHAGTMVVLMSTYELKDLPPAARSSGAAAYVNKDELSGRVLRALWRDGGDPAFAAIA
jgi:DNA-binding NarL/FixJ family response regulator